jgi:hypothetical protein
VKRSTAACGRFEPLHQAPGSAEEKVAEIEAALEYEIKVGCD